MKKYIIPIWSLITPRWRIVPMMAKGIVSTIMLLVTGCANPYSYDEVDHLYVTLETGLQTKLVKSDDGFIIKSFLQGKLIGQFNKGGLDIYEEYVCVDIPPFDLCIPNTPRDGEITDIKSDKYIESRALDINSDETWMFTNRSRFTDQTSVIVWSKSRGIIMYMAKSKLETFSNVSVLASNKGVLASNFSE